MCFVKFQIAAVGLGGCEWGLVVSYTLSNRVVSALHLRLRTMERYISASYLFSPVDCTFSSIFVLGSGVLLRFSMFSLGHIAFLIFLFIASCPTGILSSCLCILHRWYISRKPIFLTSYFNNLKNRSMYVACFSVILNSSVFIPILTSFSSPFLTQTPDPLPILYLNAPLTVS